MAFADISPPARRYGISSNMNPVIPSFFKRLLVIVVCLLAGIYGADYLWLQLRLESKNPSAAMDSVTRFDATTLKNGKLQIFFDHPETQRCVRSLLPHLGYTPCWYLKRAGQDIKQISRVVRLPSRRVPRKEEMPG